MISAIGTTASRTVAQVPGSDDPLSGGVRYDVEILIYYPDLRLRPDMSCEISITVETLEQVLVVPSAAIGTDADGNNYVVLVHKDSGGIGVLGTNQVSATTEKHTVTVESRDKDYAAVSGHISEGDVIAADLASLESIAASN